MQTLRVSTFTSQSWLHLKANILEYRGKKKIKIITDYCTDSFRWRRVTVVPLSLIQTTQFGITEPSSVTASAEQRADRLLS